MASIREVIEGLQILAKTAEIPAGLRDEGETDGMTGFVEAGHDIIWGPTADPTSDDIMRLKELGWHFDDESDCWARFC